MEDTEKNTLLIVDDDTFNLNELSNILKMDYTIRLATDGATALRIVDKFVPDLILMDILMPDMDGYTLFEELKKSERTSKIPVIFITGLNNHDDEKKGLILGAVDYINKPFNDIIVKLRIQHQIRIINQMRTIERINQGLDETVRERTHELELQTEAAQVASKAKGVFLATMSHEIRTPLNAIIGMANIAQKSISEPDKSLSSINQILSSSHHLLGILNDILDMSKIDAGKLELNYEPFSAKEAYSSVSTIIEQRCLDKKIKFKTNLDEFKEVILVGDSLRFNQVMINLLGNAVKYTPENGEITLSVKTLKEDDESIEYYFSVTDTGIGMTQEQISKLFIPFEQTDSRVASKFGGTGLGLSISQNLMGMMGGKIEVESAPDAGSKFYFNLTFKKSKEHTEKTEPAAEIIDLHSKRILLVEDIEINRMVIMEILSETGAEFIEVENGQVAVDTFRNSPGGYFDFIFMDVQMPIMGGYEATRKIRSLDHPDSKSIPIIAMTANAYKEDIEEALASGMNSHVAKPVDLDNVMKALAKYFNSNE